MGSAFKLTSAVYSLYQIVMTLELGMPQTFYHCEAAILSSQCYNVHELLESDNFILLFSPVFANVHLSLPPKINMSLLTFLVGSHFKEQLVQIENLNTSS